jgi:hypothetical protein
MANRRAPSRDTQPLDYARKRPRQRRSPIERAFVILVIADTIAFAPAVTVWQCFPAASDANWLGSASSAVARAAWAAYGVLALAGVLVLVATRRQDHSWAFSLSLLLCGIMVCAGFCVDVMSH